MRALLRPLALAAALLAPAFALASPAGTPISNQASVTYVAGGSPGAAISNVVTFQIDEVIDVDVTLLTVGNVIVAPAAVGERVTFRVENVGNGAEPFTLAVFNGAVTDDFDPIANAIFIDTDPDGPGPLLPDGIFNLADDLPYDPFSPPILDANAVGRESVAVFVFNDIPGPGPPPADGDLGDTQLTATSVTGAGLAGGDEVIGGGDGGVDAVIALGGPSSSAVGTYQIASAIVQTVKSGTVLGPLAVPGATIEYQLDVTASGAGTATAVVITDAIPVNTTYVPGSIVLDAVPRTDVPGDGADFNVTNPGAITVDLGDMTSITPQRTITFRVTIN